VDTARIFALSAGIRETNTPQRLRAAGLRWRMNPSEVEAWLDGFHYIQLTRLLQQRDQGRRGIPLTNDLNPDSLNELERRILKESFQQARKLQRRLEQYFQF
jgi:CBS domain-containing protein